MTSTLETRRVPIPKGVTVQIAKDGTLTAKGPKGTVTRRLHHADIVVGQADGFVTVGTDSTRRKISALAGTFAAHAKNTVEGAAKGFEVHLKVVFAHFPIKTKVQGAVFTIENFLGERSARRATILPGVKVEAKGPDVVVTGPDIEAVSQTAANIELATRVRNRDPRAFQDGIYITQKAGA